MTDRDKLIALLVEAESLCAAIDCYDGAVCEYAGEVNGCAAFRADHLLANGVTFATDNHVGGKWIPVTERLPEKNTAVIAATDNGIVFQCLYAYDGWDLWEGNEVNVTHWMPLPEPPKEDE